MITEAFPVHIEAKSLLKAHLNFYQTDVFVTYGNVHYDNNINILMTSHFFWQFLTYLPTRLLPTLSYSITSDFRGYLGPPHLP